MQGKECKELGTVYALYSKATLTWVAVDDKATPQYCQQENNGCLQANSCLLTIGRSPDRSRAGAVNVRLKDARPLQLRFCQQPRSVYKHHNC